MSDLISRADAIEAVCGVVIDEFDVSPTRGYEVAEKALSALPSADAVSREWYDDAVKANHELAFTDLPDIPDTTTKRLSARWHTKSICSRSS